METVECVVEYDYNKEQPDELNIRVGDVITHVERVEGGWWRGRLRGEVGMFPDNFVKVLPGAPLHPPKGEDVLLRGKKRCRVLFSYNPAHDDELHLLVDDNIDFLCEVEDGWWKGRLNGRVGVFPSNFVEMCNTDCDTSGPATLQEKNKKNSLSGGAGHHQHSNGLPPSSQEEPPAHYISNGTEPDRSSTSGANGGTPGGHPSAEQHMTTSERVLRNTAPPPDKAPRLPPKPDQADRSPVELRKDSGARPIHKSLSASDARPTFARLFEPEDEPMGGPPLFGSLASRLHEDRRSSVRSVAAVGQGKEAPSKPGFFKKLRHSFSGPGRISRYFSGSRNRLSSTGLEAQSVKTVSPPVKRRNSFATFLKKLSPSPSGSKYDLKIELSGSHKRLSQSWEFGQMGCLSASHTGLQSPASCQDFTGAGEALSEVERLFPSTAEGDEELNDDFFQISSREPHMSGDSGIATTLGDTRLSVSADEIFGPPVEYTEETHQEIFGSWSPPPVGEPVALLQATSSGELLTARSLNGKQLPSPLDRNLMAARLESAAIAEESEEEEVVVAVLGCPNRQEDLASVGMVQGPPWRSRTRTNPYVNWCPPDSVARMEKPVEVTEL